MVNEWLVHNQRRWKIQTLIFFRGQCSKYIIPSLGNIKTPVLLPNTIEDKAIEWEKLVRARGKVGGGWTIVNEALATLNRICAFAIKRKYMKTNPKGEVEKLKRVKNEENDDNRAVDPHDV